MISLYLTLLFFLLLIRMILMNSILPFQIDFNYQTEQIVNENFTIEIQLKSNQSFLIDCQDKQETNCLVDLIVQIRSTSSLIDVSCQLPAVFYRDNLHYTCLLSEHNIAEQPSITMIVNAHQSEEIHPIAKAKFSSSKFYSFRVHGKHAIHIDAKRIIRSIGIDDAYESESDDLECLAHISANNNGLAIPPNLLDESANLGFGLDANTEYDDSMPESCTIREPLFGNRHVESIRVANAPNLIIDARINLNGDSDSDGIDFPLMDKYIIRVRMREFIYLQYVTVPASNVNSLIVVVYYDSGRSRRLYRSLQQTNPVVEKFLTDEPTRFFEVYLSGTDDNAPPNDVTLDVAYCLAPPERYPVVRIQGDTPEQYRSAILSEIDGSSIDNAGLLPIIRVAATGGILPNPQVLPIGNTYYVPQSAQLIEQIVNQRSAIQENFPISSSAGQAPAHYSCYNNIQMNGHPQVQGIFHINNNEQPSLQDSHSFSSFHYPYHTIVINLKLNIYVQSLTLGAQSNVERYGLRLYNPTHNVDDTYYSSISSEYGNQPAITGIPLAKVAIRLYLNLYTTSDGRPPSHIKIILHGCFDQALQATRSSPIGGGQECRSVHPPVQLSQLNNFNMPQNTPPTIRTVFSHAMPYFNINNQINPMIYPQFDTASFVQQMIHMTGGTPIIPPENIPRTVFLGQAATPSINSYPSSILTVNPRLISQSPAHYSCYNNVQMNGHPQVQGIFHINNNEQPSLQDGHSFSSFHYPYHTIVINLKLNIYVQSLTLGEQSNVERYGLRLYNPTHNVDDTYYSSISSEYGNQPAITGIPLAKVAIRLYLNLYTTSDGRPPSHIKIILHGCFDQALQATRSSPIGGGQECRSVYPSQLPYANSRSVLSPQLMPWFSGMNSPQNVSPMIRTIYSQAVPYFHINSPSSYMTYPAESQPIIYITHGTSILQAESAPFRTIPPSINSYPSSILTVNPRLISQSPAHYSCYNNVQMNGHPQVQGIFHISNNEQPSLQDGHSFSSFHYPYHTIVINLKLNIYVQSLTLGEQSNVERYGLRLYNPTHNVDDTYYSSISSEYGNQPAITGIPLAKVAIRLYLNLYTTSDGRPPSHIKIILHGCFDQALQATRSSPIGGGQECRSVYPSQLPYANSRSVSLPQQPQIGSYYCPIITQSSPSITSGGLIYSEPSVVRTNIPYSSVPYNPTPFSRSSGLCFEQIPIVGGSHITMIRSRNLAHPRIGPEINFGGSGYTFPSASDKYELEIHFAQPFTLRYIYIPYTSNVESFKVEASHAGMIGVFISKTTKDGLVVDGFPSMLISMLVITFLHTNDGYLPSHITLSIGVCNPIYSPSNEGNETPDIIDCVAQLRLVGNSKQISRVDIRSSTRHLKPTNLMNPNQQGMDFPTSEIYTIEIALTSIMTIESVAINSASNVDSFNVQFHFYNRYYLEISSTIPSKIITGLDDTQANFVRIILLGTDDGNPPRHVSFKIAACIPTRLPKIMRSPFKYELITKRKKPSKHDRYHPTPAFPGLVEQSFYPDTSLPQQFYVPSTDEPFIRALPAPILYLNHNNNNNGAGPRYVPYNNLQMIQPNPNPLVQIQPYPSGTSYIAPSGIQQPVYPYLPTQRSIYSPIVPYSTLNPSIQVHPYLINPATSYISPSAVQQPLYQYLQPLQRSVYTPITPYFALNQSPHLINTGTQYISPYMPIQRSIYSPITSQLSSGPTIEIDLDLTNIGGLNVDPSRSQLSVYPYQPIQRSIYTPITPYYLSNPLVQIQPYQGTSIQQGFYPYSPVQRSIYTPITRYSPFHPSIQYQSYPGNMGGTSYISPSGIQQSLYPYLPMQRSIYSPITSQLSSGSTIEIDLDLTNIGGLNVDPSRSQLSVYPYQPIQRSIYTPITSYYPSNPTVQIQPYQGTSIQQGFYPYSPVQRSIYTPITRYSQLNPSLEIQPYLTGRTSYISPSGIQQSVYPYLPTQRSIYTPITSQLSSGATIEIDLDLSNIGDLSMDPSGSQRSMYFSQPLQRSIYTPIIRYSAVNPSVQFQTYPANLRTSFLSPSDMQQSLYLYSPVQRSIYSPITLQSMTGPTIEIDLDLTNMGPSYTGSFGIQQSVNPYAPIQRSIYTPITRYVQLQSYLLNTGTSFLSPSQIQHSVYPYSPLLRSVYSPVVPYSQINPSIQIPPYATNMGRTLYISLSGIQQSQYPYSPIQRSIYSPITSQLSLSPTIEIDLDLSNIGGLNVDPSRSQLSVYPYQPIQRSIYTPITRYLPLTSSVQYPPYPTNIGTSYISPSGMQQLLYPYLPIQRSIYSPITSQLSSGATIEIDLDLTNIGGLNVDPSSSQLSVYPYQPLQRSIYSPITRYYSSYPINSAPSYSSPLGNQQAVYLYSPVVRAIGTPITRYSLLNPTNVGTSYISPSGIQQSLYPYLPMQRSIYSPITSQLSSGPTIEIDLDLTNIGGLNVDPSRSQFSVYPYSPMQRSIYTPITRYYPLNPSVQYQSYPGNTGGTSYISPSGIQQSLYPYLPIQRSIYSPITSQLSSGPTIEIDLDLTNIGGLNVDPSRSQLSVYPYSPIQRSIYTPITRYYPLNPSVQYQSYPGNMGGRSYISSSGIQQSLYPYSPTQRSIYTPITPYYPSNPSLQIQPYPRNTGSSYISLPGSPQSLYLYPPVQRSIYSSVLPQLSSRLTGIPDGYSCTQNYQLTGTNHIHSVYTLSQSTQSSLLDPSSMNSLLSNNGYSFSSHHYPFLTIIINLKFPAYVQSLSLGSSSNIQRFGLRLYNPNTNVDDTYYSSIDPTNGQPTVSNIPQSKIAVRLYLNLYTTTDGRPPTNIQINLNICFDLQTITDLNIGAARTVMMPSHHRVPPSKFIIHTSDPTMESPFSRTLNQIYPTGSFPQSFIRSFPSQILPASYIHPGIRQSVVYRPSSLVGHPRTIARNSFYTPIIRILNDAQSQETIELTIDLNLMPQVSSYSSQIQPDSSLRTLSFGSSPVMLQTQLYPRTFNVQSYPSQTIPFVNGNMRAAPTNNFYLSQPTIMSETCTCQCPSSGMISMMYNANQRSCTVAFRGRRRRSERS